MGTGQDHRRGPRDAARPRVQHLSSQDTPRPSRVVAVAPERLAGWIERFGDRHGQLVWSFGDEYAAVAAADGARAEFVLPYPAEPAANPEQLLAQAASFRDFGLVLLRRGGFAVGLVRDAELSGSRCGTKYVQGQTKAGGWSQQRYARRRANQADDLAGAAAQAVHDVLGPALRDPDLCLVVGGDRALLTRCLDLASGGVTGGGLVDRVLEHRLEIPDPRRRVLEEAVGHARAVRIALNDLA